MKNVLLLHGYLESKEIWKDLAERLKFNVITLDLLGHGANPRANFSTISEMAQDVVSKLRDQNIHSYSVVGHSMGGYVALELFEKDENCEEVVLLNSNFWEDSDEKKQDRLRVIDAVNHNKQRFVKEVIPNLFANPLNYQVVIDALIKSASQMTEEGIGNASLAMRNREDKTFLLKSNPDKVFVIQGVDDPVMPLKTMLSKIPQKVRLEQLPGGHMSWCESQLQLVGLLNDFLAV
ncbi:MAG: alpha/beta fold hydrolase [Crocinitomicaceae bacterium]